MDYFMTQADAARDLGISAQAFIKGSEYSELKVTEKGVLAPLLMAEISRRYKVVECALRAKEGECLCCRNPIGISAKGYLPGHDSILRGALQTLYNLGRSTERLHVEEILRGQGKTLNDFFRIMNISHLVKESEE